MTKLVVIIGFAVAFAAGLIIGIESRGSGAASTTGPTVSSAMPSTRPMRHGGGWLNSELNLSPQQQEGMKKIWSDGSGGGGSRGRDQQQEKRQALKKQRDEAIATMLGPVEKAKYDEIQKSYQDQIQALDHEMRAGFEAKVKQTMELLSPEQRTKYEEILKRHQWDRGGDRGPGRGGEKVHGGPGPGGFGPSPHDREHSRRSDAGATSKPATSP